MTGMELLKLMDEAGIEYMTGCRCIYKLQISDLAKFIDEYFLPRPLFEDGTPVKVEDRCMLYGTADREVTDYCVWDDGSFAINNFQYDQDQRVMKPEPADSWEKLEEDMMRGTSCLYFGGGESALECWDCPNGTEQTGTPCWKNERIDILKRAKKLAGIEEEVRNGD